MNIQELWGIRSGASSYKDQLIFQIQTECPLHVIRGHPAYSQNITYCNICNYLPSHLLKQTVTSVSRDHIFLVHFVSERSSILPGTYFQIESMNIVYEANTSICVDTDTEISGYIYVCLELKPGIFSRIQ